MKLYVTTEEYVHVSTGVKVDYKQEHGHPTSMILNGALTRWQTSSSQVIFWLFDSKLAHYHVEWNQHLTPSFELRALRLCPQYIQFHKEHTRIFLAAKKCCGR